MTASDVGVSTTTYLYDHEDDLAIKRDPGGEVSFVNEGYTSYSNGRKWKNVIVDGVPAATKRVEPQGGEPVQYYFTPDLLGSQYLVTGGGGSAYEHVVFFPSGELWINQLGTETRERDLFAGSHYDRRRNLHMMGDRLYEPREGMFYATDPVVVGDLDVAIEEPRVLAPYTYSYDNPETYFDETGEFGIAASTVLRTAALQGTKRAAATAHAWLRADTDYNDSISKLGRDDHGRRVLAFVKTDRESRLESAIADVETLIEIEVELGADGNIVGIGEAKINKLKSTFRFLKKHRFRRSKK